MLLTTNIKILARVYVLISAFRVKESDALVEPLDCLPPDLEGYLDTCRSFGDLTQQSGRLVFWTSINQYTSRFARSRTDLTSQQAVYLSNSLNAALVPLYRDGSGPRFGRGKRQAPGRRVRKEIRAMTNDERRRYFATVNGMKNDRQLPPNVYDFLAAYHSGDTIQTAHFGPAFPSWHRLYLWIFEYFLRLQDPSVTIPYWASVLDNEMQDSTQSVIWSPAFFGNSDGAIRTGPFRNWPQINPQTSFTRNVQGGQLFTYDGINRILNRTRNSEILVPTALPDSNLEIQHGAPHVFVGGSMNNLNFAARDPIFFSHHCFVDGIWERFRQNQIRNSINPQMDFPFNETDPRFRPQHRPTANAGFTGIGTITGLTGLGEASTWTQNAGYLNEFSDLVMYEEVPRCPFCANSPYLFCNTSLNPSRCVSRSIAEMRRSGNVAAIESVPARRMARQVPSMMFLQQPQTSINFSQDVSLDVCPKRTLINDVETRWLGQSESEFRVSANNLAYIPVTVVSKRPIEYTQFNKYSLYNRRTSAHLGFKDELLKPGLQKHYDNCENFQDAAGKITIVSHGLNYDGYAEEYVIMDNRLGVAEANGFIPVKMPTRTNLTEAIIAAFDSCGRVCKPFLKRGPEQTDNTFSGGIRISQMLPLQFSNSYANALLNIWDVPSRNLYPILNHDNIPLSFFCEYTDTWIWDAPKQRRGQSLIDQCPGSLINPNIGSGDIRLLPTGARLFGDIGSAAARNSAFGGRGGRPPQKYMGIWESAISFPRRGSNEIVQGQRSPLKTGVNAGCTRSSRRKNRVTGSLRRGKARHSTPVDLSRKNSFNRSFWSLFWSLNGQ